MHIPSPLYSYTGGQHVVEAKGSSVRAVVAALDRKYPGFAFRIVDEMGDLRRHIRIFVDGTAQDDLDVPVTESTVLHIVAALSGG